MELTAEEKERKQAIKRYLEIMTYPKNEINWIRYDPLTFIYAGYPISLFPSNIPGTVRSNGIFLLIYHI